VSAAVQPATEAIIGLLSQAGAVPSGTHRGADRTCAVQGVDH
jgi:hypothetical protein